MKALQLAGWLEDQYDPTGNYEQAAAELRRLHDENENTLKHFSEAVEAYKVMAVQRDDLLSALQRMVKFLEAEAAHLANYGEIEAARAAIVKVCEST